MWPAGGLVGEDMGGGVMGSGWNAHVALVGPCDHGVSCWSRDSSVKLVGR